VVTLGTNTNVFMEKPHFLQNSKKLTLTLNQTDPCTNPNPNTYPKPKPLIIFKDVSSQFSII